MVIDFTFLDEFNDTLYTEGGIAGEKQCMEVNSKVFLNVPHCKGVWDRILCWPPTPVNTVATGAYSFNVPPFNTSEFFALRFCNSSGFWEPDWTNYTHVPVPFTDVENQPAEKLAKILSMVYFFCSLLSCIMLLITLFIFCYFRSLSCPRIRIHRNLVLSFIMRYIIIIIHLSPFVTQVLWMRQIDWLCRLFVVLMYYSIIANTAWMFIEGLYLHNNVAVSVFNTEFPSKLYHLIGWGTPCPFVITWSIIMHLKINERCWKDNKKDPNLWFILAPILAFLIVNFLFLVNIIRILVLKLRANHNNVEFINFQKAVKATLVLFPLLGLTNILFGIEPQSGFILVTFYRITNAVLQSSQGMFVSIIYCFANTEVRNAIRRRLGRSSRFRRRSSAVRTTIFTSSSYLNFKRSNDVIRITPPLGRFENIFSDKGSTNERQKVTCFSITTQAEVKPSKFKNIPSKIQTYSTDGANNFE